jgi:hypothetical protein
MASDTPPPVEAAAPEVLMAQMDPQLKAEQDVGRSRWLRYELYA